jgi:hypothetical protein
MTKDDIAAKLRGGWSLLGDTGEEDSEFTFHSPNPRRGVAHYPEKVPWQWMMELFEQGILVPDPQPGKEQSYRMKGK